MDLDRERIAAALPGYVIGEEIGRGGWGTVLRAQHVALGRDVAIKQLPRTFADDQGALARFISEARIIGQLDHPHIVKVYDFVEHDGTWLIVMELLSGGTLWEYFKNFGTRADQACGIGLAMCSALEAAHEHGILHRDLKPENILFSAEGVARLGDFGIAKEVNLDARHTRAGEVIGTPTYMSPEQAFGNELGPTSDIYSLGIVLYEQLAGRIPFPEAQTPLESLFQHAREVPAPLGETAPDVPALIAATIMTALNKDANDRFPSAEAFGVALAQSCAASFGARWLHNSGTKLMGGGPIAAAALSAPTIDVVVRQPTTAMPALRNDHFIAAPLDPDASLATPASTPPPQMATPQMATPPPTAYPTPNPVDGFTLHPTPVPMAAAPPQRGNKRVLWLVLAAVLVFVLVGAGSVGMVALRSNSAGPNAQPVAVTGPTSLSPSTVTIKESTSGPVSTPPSTPTPPPATAAPVRECKGGVRCIFIDGIKAQGDSYLIKWTAVGFDPSFKDGFFHAHFFWDIYTPDQAGTNASTFNVAQGQWEITDKTNFQSTGEVRVSNRPAPANRICVTVGNFAHAVADPRQFDCVAIPT